MRSPSPTHRLPQELPSTRCPAANGTNICHKWVPAHADELRCCRCLINLRADQLQLWLRQARRDRSLETPADSLTVSRSLDALDLTPAERSILLNLASRPDLVMGSAELARCIGHQPSTGHHDPAALAVLVASLCEKLASLRAQIITVPGVGYRFEFVAGQDTADR